MHKTTNRQESPALLRHRIRDGLHRGHTSGFAAGYLQGNLVILPGTLAQDFLLYCHRNAKPCPLIAVGDPGDPALPTLGDGIDIRTDVPGYRVFRNGIPEESVNDLRALWRDDHVAFVLGCSFSFEDALQEVGIPVRHIDADRNVPMYRTNIQTRAAGPFQAPLVVSLRAFKPAHAIEAILLSTHYRLAHGAPVHLGDPAAIGIEDVMQPDFGDPPVIEDGDVLVYWACGVTPQMALHAAAADLAFTHEPGHMLVTDVPSATAENRLAGL